MVSTKKSASVNLIRLVDDEKEIEEQYLSVSQDSSSVNFDHFLGEQKKQIEELCDPELFKSTPVCTTLVQHSAGRYTGSYRIPVFIFLMI